MDTAARVTFGNDAAWRPCHTLPAGVGFSNKQPSPLCSEVRVFCQCMLGALPSKNQTNPNTSKQHKSGGCVYNQRSLRDCTIARIGLLEASLPYLCLGSGALKGSRALWVS